MPLDNVAFREDQRAWRKFAIPGMVCGQPGNAAERHRAAPTAKAIRCCPLEPGRGLTLAAGAAGWIASGRDRRVTGF